MKLTTDAIQRNGLIDARYTCDLDNSSPELRWSDWPEQTESFALVCEDPDAPGGLFTHWVIYGITPDIHHLPAGIPPQETLPNGIRQGVNSLGKLGYSGPCPPTGDSPHRYVFRLYALRGSPQIPERATRQELLETLTPWVITTAEVMGRYQRMVQKAG